VTDLQARTGERLAIHTGINSGLILAQYGDNREGLYQLTGDTLNTAARLRALASADEILVGPATARRVKPYFKLEALPAATVKGKSDPLVPHRIVRELPIRSRFEAARERGFRHYVGREAELATLRGCLSHALMGEGQVVTIEGEPGIGKSRLMYEFLSSIDHDAISVSEGRCQAHGADIPYFPFLDSLWRGLKLSEHDSHAETLTKAVANIRRVDPSLERYLPCLLHLLAVPSEHVLPADLSGDALRRALEEALVALITQVTKLKALVLVIEDWHWSDPASQSALRRLLPFVSSHRLMLVVSYRSGYRFDFGTLRERNSISLKPLTVAEAEELICSATSAQAVPAGLGELICQSADGNPLFVEEACYSLLESGAISVGDRQLVLCHSLDQLLLPDTVQAVIRARLDRLDEGAKEVVGMASVIGRVFTWRILSRIYAGRAPLDETLEALQSQEIVRQTRIVPEPEYTFRHVLTREVAYDALLLRQRKRLHAVVGEAIEELYPERLEENAPLLAYHYARSPRAEKAVRYTLLAGDRAARLYANAEAAVHFEDALTLVRAVPKSPEADAAQIDAILGQVAAGTAPRDMDRDRDNLEQACALAEGLGDRHRLARALYWLGRNHYVLAKLERAIEYAQRSLEIADAIGDAALAAAPVNLMGRAYWQLSDFPRSAQMMERNIEQMRELGNRSEEATACGFLSALFGYMGEFDKALAYSERSLTLARELNNPYAESAGFHYRGIIRDQQGQWDRALADYAAAEKIAQSATDMFRVYIVKFMTGRARHLAGDPEGGRALIEEAVTLAGKIGTTFLLGQATSFLASAVLACGATAEARALCDDAVAMAKKAGDKFTEAIALRTLGETLSSLPASQRDVDPICALQDAVRMQSEIGAQPELARSHQSLSRVLEAAGRAAEAATHRDKAQELMRKLDMEWDLAQASRSAEPVVHCRDAQ
jgi:tetratricopeptide (TPR) repeat protein